MPEPVTLSSRLRSLFSETKLFCFGRYALQVPIEANLVIGDASFPSTIKVIQGGAEVHDEIISEEISRLKRKNDAAEIVFNGPGPVENSRQIRYFEGWAEKEYNLHITKTLRALGNQTFIMTSAVYEGESEISAKMRETTRIRNLRERAESEIPLEAGYCIEQGFIASDRYKGQEMVSVGIHFPAYPDISFFIHSNKDAYSDYPTEEFEKVKREELPLLARIKQAQDLQGLKYPSRTVLREGKRAVHHWQGEESLIRRADGTHDFEWSFVGTPKDIANPSVFDVGMFTKVAHDTVGAAEKSSLTDEEAVALWDKLLSGLKFRVKVPGAPEGSYYFLPGEKTSEGAKP